MAALVTTVQDKTTNVPSLVNSISDVSAVHTNKSAGAFVEGAASLFDEGVKATDKGIERNMGKRAYELVDEKRDSFGVGEAALNARMGLPIKDATLDPDGAVVSDTDAETGAGTSDATDFSSAKRQPPAIDRGIDRASRIQRAGDIGKLSPSEYNANMEAVVRQLRAEYPGYRDQIDQKISQITGMTPANALRSSLLRDQIALQRQDQTGARAEQKYRDTNSKYVQPGEENLPLPQFRAKVTAAQQQEHQITAASANLTLSSANDTDVSRRAQQVVTGGLQIDGDKTFQTLVGPINEKIDKLETALDVKQIEALRPQIGAIKLKMDNTFEAWLDRPTDFDPANPSFKGKEKTFRQLINDPAKVAGMKKDYLSKVDAWEQRLINNETGTLNWDKNSAASSASAADAGLMRNQQLATFAGVSTRFGPAVANTLLATPATKDIPAILPTIQKAILGAGKMGLVTPGGDNPSATAKKAEDAAAKPGAEPVTAAMYRTQIKDTARVMSDKNLPDEARANAARSVISDVNYIYKFKAGAGQVHAFTSLTSPEVTDSIHNLSVAEPKLWTDYRNNAVRQFTGVYKNAADTLQAVVTDKNYDTKFDEKSGQFSITPKAGVGRDNPGFNDVNANVVRQADQLNEGLRALSYIMKKDKADVGPEILKIATSMGVDINAPKEDFWGAVVKSVHKVYGSASDRLGSAFEPNIYDGAGGPGKKG
jgi:hypothetical protein